MTDAVTSSKGLQSAREGALARALIRQVIFRDPGAVEASSTQLLDMLSERLA